MRKYKTTPEQREKAREYNRRWREKKILSNPIATLRKKAQQALNIDSLTGTQSFKEAVNDGLFKPRIPAPKSPNDFVFCIISGDFIIVNPECPAPRLAKFI
ncbi:MAG: hypothetical protein KBC72_00630 [Acinetobacter sp.]|nr:hypothetical protein [Acinetobacter sp.]